MPCLLGVTTQPVQNRTLRPSQTWGDKAGSSRGPDPSRFPCAPPGRPGQWQEAPRFETVSCEFVEQRAIEAARRTEIHVLNRGVLAQFGLTQSLAEPLVVAVGRACQHRHHAHLQSPPHPPEDSPTFKVTY
jgi:hypothetical protein